jgi:phosphate transport system substrate-binding protein
MKRCSRNVIVVVAVLFLVGPFIINSASASSKETLIITGTGASVGTMQLMAKAFQKNRPNVNISILPSIGSTGGISAVQEGKIDIGLSSRSLKPEERSGEIVEELYGRTAFIFGVQDPNPTKGLRLAEIEEIYTGQRKTWSDGTPIRLILRPLSDSYSDYLASINPGLKSASEKARSIPGVFVGNTDQEAALQIEKTPGAFGTTSGSIIAAEKRKLKALSVDGVAPTLANVSTGKYPYVMTLSLVYKRDKYKGSIKDFIEFVFSKDGKKLLSDNSQVALQRIMEK